MGGILLVPLFSCFSDFFKVPLGHIVETEDKILPPVIRCYFRVYLFFILFFWEVGNVLCLSIEYLLHIGCIPDDPVSGEPNKYSER